MHGSHSLNSLKMHTGVHIISFTGKQAYFMFDHCHQRSPGTERSLVASVCNIGRTMNDLSNDTTPMSVFSLPYRSGYQRRPVQQQLSRSASIFGAGDASHVQLPVANPTSSSRLPQSAFVWPVLVDTVGVHVSCTVRLSSNGKTIITLDFVSPRHIGVK